MSLGFGSIFGPQNQTQELDRFTTLHPHWLSTHMKRAGNPQTTHGRLAGNLQETSETVDEGVQAVAAVGLPVGVVSAET